MFSHISARCRWCKNLVQFCRCPPLYCPTLIDHRQIAPKVAGHMPASGYRNRRSFLSSGAGGTSKLRCFGSLECDDDLTYLLITLKVPICVGCLFEREGTVHMGFERTI